jgi:hypothetical protein
MPNLPLKVVPEIGGTHRTGKAGPGRRFRVVGFDSGGIAGLSEKSITIRAL